MDYGQEILTLFVYKVNTFSCFQRNQKHGELYQSSYCLCQNIF